MCGSHQMWVPYEYLMNPCGSRTWVPPKHIVDLWMIRAIHARSDGSRFVDDVAQCGGKNPPTLGLVKIKCKFTTLYKLTEPVDLLATRNIEVQKKLVLSCGISMIRHNILL
jgi:hypothetical protein